MAIVGLYGYVLLLTFSTFSLGTVMKVTKRSYSITKTQQKLKGTDTSSLQNFPRKYIKSVNSLQILKSVQSKALVKVFVEGAKPWA